MVIWRKGAGIAVAVLVVAGCGSGGSKGTPGAQRERPACPTVAGGLPGMRSGPAPWPPELANLGERLDRIGLPRLTQEGVALDLHVHIGVEVEGRKVEVPAGIGLNGEEANGGRMVTGFVSAIHTHDASGLVHVHSPDVRPYTLGQVFDVWGLTLTSTRLAGYCAGVGRSLVVEVDGQAATADPRKIPLSDGQQITLTYGKA